MSERQWTIVYPSPSMPAKYLSAIETFEFGTEYVAHFSVTPSHAMPLTKEEAEKLCKIIQKDRLTHTPKLQIVPVPWSKADNYPFEEVSVYD